jgi:hypothetical protein
LGWVGLKFNAHTHYDDAFQGNPQSKRVLRASQPKEKKCALQVGHQKRSMSLGYAMVKRKGKAQREERVDSENRESLMQITVFFYFSSN